LICHRKIDQHVADRLRTRRSLLGLSMEVLADKVGLTYQQIQKYETAKNRISASRLFQFGIILEVPVSYFYEGLYKNTPLETALNELSELPEVFFEDNFFIQPENFELLGSFHKIKNTEFKETIFKLLKLAGQDK
jgi:transcriptional regulator with XRE-family HTH domain